MTITNGTSRRERVGNSSKVWATLITDLSYLPGLIVLDYSLKRSKSQYPLVALYFDGFPAEGHEALDRRGIPKRNIAELRPATDVDLGNDPRFKDVWSKLAIYELSEYDRVVLLDADMLVRQNMDELMDIELDSPSLNGTGKRIFAATHACVCNPAKKPHYPKDWVPEHCGFTHQHSDPDRAQVSGASNMSSFGMPNSGTVVANPCPGIYEQIIDKLRDEEAVKSYMFPDQALLGDAFRGRWVTLPYIYNGLKSIRPQNVHGTIWRDDKVKNVHYIWSPKPWDEKPKESTDETFHWWHDMNKDRLEDERKNGIIDAFRGAGC